MFSYYGSKSKIVDYYPPPKHKRIIESFAGSARYSLKYWQNDVLLVDKYPVIIGIWKWLQQCSKDDILKLPILKAGDKINVIAQTYKVTIDELTEWNKLSSPNLYVGQSITIKKAAAPAPKPVVPPKPVVTPKPPKQTPPPPPQKKYYSVKSGDNFSQVARKNNLTFEELKKLNPGINVNTVYIGQKLRIK